MGLLSFHIESIMFHGYTQIGFQDTVELNFHKKRITLAIFDALRLKINQPSSYGKDTVLLNINSIS